METEKWILCPACGGKTRNRIREDTLLLNYPLYCPKMQAGNPDCCKGFKNNRRRKARRTDAEPMNP